jgi:outer membrane protein assembly factor BamB
MIARLNTALGLLCLLHAASAVTGEQAPDAKPARIALLPLIGSNAAARKGDLSATVTPQVRAQLVNRREIELAEDAKVIAFLRNSPELWERRQWPECARRMGKELGLDFILVGSAVSYGTTVQATYMDLELYECGSGELAGWVCERADQVRVASMTISSPASEQMERLGSYIAAAIRKARSAKPSQEQKEWVAVFPFKESTEDVYGEAVARMFATDMMNQTAFRVLPMLRLQGEMDRPKLLEEAKKRSARHVFFGEVVSSTSSLSQVRAEQVDVATGKQVRSAVESYASDIDLRMATANLAWRFGPGGKRVLWRWSGNPSATPCFAEGRLFVGANGSKLAALNPLTGNEIWVYAPDRAHPAIGDRFFSPALFAGKLVGHGPSGAGVLSFDVKTGQLLQCLSFAGGQGSSIGERIFTDKEQLFLTSGTFHLAACGLTGNEELALQWRYRDRSSLMLGHGAQPEHVVVASRNGKLAALARKDGKVVWQQQLPDRVSAAPFVFSGRVFVGCEDGARMCLTYADGSKVWSQADKGRSLAVPVATGETVVFGNEAGGVTCYQASDGKTLWTSALDQAPMGALTLYKSLLYAFAANGYLHCLKAQTGEKLWQVNLRGTPNGAPLVVPVDTLSGDLEAEPAEWMEDYDHALFVSSSDGHLYAIGGDAPK